MSIRERIINALKKAKTNCLIRENGGCFSCVYFGKADCTLEILTDFLLKDGYIIPPCKVGDTLYYPWIYGGTSGIAMLEVSDIRITKKSKCLVYFEDPETDMPMPTCFTEDDFEQSVFTNKGVAKRVLRKCMKNDTSA